MKLKRLLCALVVFTLMMTSVVCSVSAATYQTTTVYNVGSGEGDLGSISLKTTVYGLTEGSMVSYIIYKGTSVAEDGSNIEYIDQQTADSSCTVEFDTGAKFETNTIEGMAYTFASSGNEHTSATYAPVMKTSYNGAQSDVTSTDYSTIPMGTNVAWRNYFLSFTGKNKVTYTGIETVSLSYTGYPVEDDNGIIEHELGNRTRDLIRNEVRYTCKAPYVHPGSVVEFDIDTTAGYKVTEFKLQENSDFSGDSHTVQNSTTNFADNIVGNKLKFDLYDEIANGDYFQVGGQYTIFGTTTEAVTSTEAKYIKIDGDAVYSTLKDGSEAVTFLMTKSDKLTDSDDFGINVYAYPAGSEDAEDAEAEIRFTGMKALDVDGNKFGIQLYVNADDANAKYFNSADYTLKAVPYIDGAELATTGADLFYTTTTGTLDGSFVE